MTNRFTELRQAGLDNEDKNFCTVIAWAIVAGLSYREAYGDMLLCGRARGRGIFMRAFMRFLTCKRGLKYTDVTVQYRKLGVKTVRSLETKGPKRGKFLVFVKGHVLALHDGQVMDWTAGGRKRVNQILRIEED